MDAETLSDDTWFSGLLGQALPPEGQDIVVGGQKLTMQDGILRAQQFISADQTQTKDSFGYQWSRREIFEGSPVEILGAWLREKYGPVVESAKLFETSDRPIMLDAGCGAAASGLSLFEPLLDRIRYLGADVSSAVGIARDRFRERGITSAQFLQADLNHLPIPDQSVDLIFSEGVLHHTDSTRAALAAVVRHLKPNGRILFYVYRKKGPIREFTDDYIRDQLQSLTPDEAWQKLLPLSKLGKVLGDLDLEIDVPEPIDVLEIPAGRINIQRLFYWHVFKAFYRPELKIEQMNHTNFDWYSPRNAHRQTADEVRQWCGELGLNIEHERVEDAGITVIAQRKG